MKHCLIITAYKDVQMLNRLISRTPEQWGIYVHLDLKSPVCPDEIDHRAWVFCQHKIYWGSPLHLKAILHLMKTAFQAGDWDYFHIVSGQDYYAVDPNRFDEVLGNDRRNYIKCKPLPCKGLPWNEGLDIFRCQSICRWVDVRHRFWSHLDECLFAFQHICHLGRSLPDYPLYKELVYCSLHRSFVEWTLQSEMAVGLWHRLRHAIIPEEVYFQTLIMNSPFKDTVAFQNLRFDDWSGPVQPATLDASYAGRIIGSGNLFCRKVQTGCSDELVRMLDDAME